MAKVLVEVSYLSKLTRLVRDLEVKNDKLEAGMKIITEAARESQTRSRVYSQREEPPAQKRICRGDGKSLQGGNPGQVLRGKKTMPVGGVQVPINAASCHKLNFDKISSKIKRFTTKVAETRTR